MSESSRSDRGSGDEPATGPSDRPEPKAGPSNPAKLSLRAWWGVLKRTVGEFRDDNLTDWAAALTYYAVLSIFPALVVLMSIVGLAGDSATQSLLDNLAELGPGPATDIVSGAIREVSSSQGAAGVALIVGLAAALWSASGYVGAFSRASNAIYEIEEGRPFWKLRPLQLAISMLLIMLRGRLRHRSGGHRPACRAGGERVRAREHRGDGLGHRQVAGDRDRGDDAARGPLLRSAERAPPRVSLDHARRGAGGGVVDRWRRRASRSTSPTSPHTTRPTAASPE